MIQNLVQKKIKLTFTECKNFEKLGKTLFLNV